MGKSRSKLGEIVREKQINGEKLEEIKGKIKNLERGLTFFERHFGKDERIQEIADLKAEEKKLKKEIVKSTAAAVREEKDFRKRYNSLIKAKKKFQKDLNNYERKLKKFGVQIPTTAEKQQL